MGVSLADAGYILARGYGYPGTRAEWDAYQERRRARDRWETRKERRERFKKARAAHGARAGSLRSARPAWQRWGGVRGRGSRIMPALQDPRIRGQLATRP